VTALVNGMYARAKTNARGFSFVEVLVACAVIGLMFTGLFGAIQFTVKLIGLTKAKSGAIAIANERVEYVRSLIYADIGTIAGIPSGLIPQNATTSLNGITYTTRTLIQYVDAPDDGTGALDSNGILADYKNVRVEVAWDIGFGTSTVFLVTDIVPPGIETTAGGGTLTVNVFDAEVQPLPGASVRLYNNTTTTTIDVTRNTNASGVAMFGGAPAAANYQITVTDTGYSTDQTYSATTSNPNPITSHVAVIEGAVSTMNFQIDELANLAVRTVGPATYGNFTDTFTDSALLFTQSDTTVSGGGVILLGAPGPYAPFGTVFGTSSAPTTIDEWNRVEWTASTSLLATVLVRVYAVTGTSTYTLVPDTDLPGNSLGFSGGAIDITALDVSTYPSLALGAELATTDTAVTPVLEEWEIIYTTNQPAIADIDFELRGAKTIGTDTLLMPLYKYEALHSTGGSGEVALTGLEWDIYTVTLTSGGYDIADACPNLPYILNPGSDETLTLTLLPGVLNTLRVQVTDASGNALPDATVELTRSGFSDSEDASLCGQAFFNAGLVVMNDYDLVARAPGYTDTTMNGVSIDGDTVMTVVLNP
jgi:type II secretory pathway pseudopilin PulG